MSATIVQQLIGILGDALAHPAHRRQLVADFQRLVWELPSTNANDSVVEALRELAYDLGFFEPDPAAQKEDPSFYGDEEVQERIRSVLGMLREMGVSIPPSGQDG